MKILHLLQSNVRSKEEIRRGVGSLGVTILGVVMLLSCVWTFGCSSPPESTPGPSKEEIRSDADRFFEKMEQEKQGKPETQP